MVAITAPAPAVMSMWVVTANPSDIPGKYVARRHEIAGCRLPFATADHHVADTLAEVRALLPLGSVRFERDPNDDPVIVEVWL